MVHDAVLGTTTKREVQILVGDGHVVRTFPFSSALTSVLLAGVLMALDVNRVLYPYGTSQAVSIGEGDAAELTFTGNLGKFLRPGSITITDGAETFSDDGFGTLSGDAGGSGKVNSLTGDVTVTFNAAPASEADVAASCTHWCRGCLVRDAETGATDAEVVTAGGLNRCELTMSGGTSVGTDALEEMELIGPWSA